MGTQRRTARERQAALLRSGEGQERRRCRSLVGEGMAGGGCGGTWRATTAAPCRSARKRGRREGRRRLREREQRAREENGPLLPESGRNKSKMLHYLKQRIDGCSSGRQQCLRFQEISGIGGDRSFAFVAYEVQALVREVAILLGFSGV